MNLIAISMMRWRTWMLVQPFGLSDSRTSFFFSAFPKPWEGKSFLRKIEILIGMHNLRRKYQLNSQNWRIKRSLQFTPPLNVISCGSFGFLQLILVFDQFHIKTWTEVFGSRDYPVVMKYEASTANDSSVLFFNAFVWKFHTIVSDIA